MNVARNSGIMLRLSFMPARRKVFAQSPVYTSLTILYSEHTDFSESVDEVAPLTAEEKAAKLEDLKTKLAAKRAQQAIQDKEEAKKNEEIRRKSTREGQ